MTKKPKPPNDGNSDGKKPGGRFVSRRNFLLAGGSLTAATVAATAGIPPWGRKPAPHTASHTDIVLNSSGMNDRDQQAIEYYGKLYDKFEQAMDKALRQIIKTRDQVFKHDLRFIRKGTELFFRCEDLDRGEPGKCYFKAKASGAKERDLSTMVEAVSAYIELVKQQNKIPLHLARKCQLPAVPTGGKLTDFINRRFTQLFPDQHIPDVFLSGVLRVFGVTCLNHKIIPRFTENGLPGDHTGQKWIVDESNYVIYPSVLNLPDGGAAPVPVFDIPSKKVEREKWRGIIEDEKTMNQISEASKPKVEEFVKFQQNFGVSLFGMTRPIQIPVEIIVANPYYNRQWESRVAPSEGHPDIIR